MENPPGRRRVSFTQYSRETLGDIRDCLENRGSVVKELLYLPADMLSADVLPWLSAFSHADLGVLIAAARPVFSTAKKCAQTSSAPLSGYINPNGPIAPLQQARPDSSPRYRPTLLRFSRLHEILESLTERGNSFQQIVAARSQRPSEGGVILGAQDRIL